MSPYDRRGKDAPRRPRRDRPAGPPRGAEERPAPARPTDPRVCRHCGERVLDMKYHLEHAHPRPRRGERPVQLDPRTEDALRQVSALLEEGRDLVFKEPLRAIKRIERAHALVAWARDHSKPLPPVPAAVPPAAPGKRVDMRARPGPKPGEEP